MFWWKIVDTGFSAILPSMSIVFSQAPMICDQHDWLIALVLSLGWHKASQRASSHSGLIVWTPMNSRFYSSHSFIAINIKPSYVTKATINSAWFFSELERLISSLKSPPNFWMADESSILSMLSSNLHVKWQIISEEHTHLKSTPYTWPPCTKPQHLPTVAVANLTLFLSKVSSALYLYLHWWIRIC